MYQVKFNGSDKIYDISGYAHDMIKNTVKLTGENIPVDNFNGFVLLINGKVVTDFSDFKTKYNVLTELENGIMFSNDGSTETEDNRIRIPDAASEAEMLKQIKQDRIYESKVLLAEYLASHPLISSCHGGKEGTYNVTEEKQTQMMSQYMTYQIEKQLNPDAKLTWNESGEECEEWTEEEFLQLVLQVKRYVYPMVSYQQSVEKSIAKCATTEEVDLITIDYSSLSEG